MTQKFHFILFLILSLPTFIFSQNESTMGKWGEPIEFGIVPVAVANLPNGNLLTWSSQYRNSFRTEGDGMTFTEIFNPFGNGGLGAALGEFTSNTDHDMFCPGINNLADGRILSAGGTSSERTSIYDWRTNSWTVADQMNIPRGYQGNVTLSDGSVFTVGGSWSGGNWGNRDAEIYSSLTGWLRLPNIQGEDIFVNADYAEENQGNYRIDNHVWLWPAPNGKLFHAGPSEMMHWIDVDVPGGAIVEAGIRQDGSFRDYYSMKGNTVMFEAGKILKTGGAGAYGDDNIGTVAARDNSFIIDLNGVQYGNLPPVTFTGNMANERTMHNSTVLPNGEVLITGGLRKAAVFTDVDAVFEAEIFNPYASGNKWRTVAGMATPRTYHSVAILMTDGRVFVGGGGLCDSTEDCVNHTNAEIYSPPYLFNPDNTPATRPEINAGPLNANYGEQITISASTGIQEFSLIRFSAATHSTNNEQRRIAIESFTNNGSDYNFTIPQRELLPPGYYMLFALNANGVPSIAHTLQIGSEIPLTNNSNLVLDLKFDETTGNNVMDSSQYNHNGTIVQRDDNGNPESPNQHEWSNGIIGKALEFDGLEFNSNSLLDIPHSPELANTTSSITISAWVYRNDNSRIPQASNKVANVGIFSQAYPSMFFGFHNTLYKWAFRADSPLDCYAGYAPLNTWVHLAATYNGSVAKLYANGIEVCSRPMSGPINLLNDNSVLSNFTVSGFYEDGERTLPAVPYGNTSGITDEISGKIDMLKVYNKVLEPSEIQALYNEGLNTGHPEITNCQGNYLTSEYKIGINGSWITSNVITAPEGSQVYIRPKDYSGEYFLTTTQYDGPTFSNVTNSDKFTDENAYQIDTNVVFIADSPWNNPDRGNGNVDSSNEGQFVLTTPDGCPTTVYFSLVETNTGDGCPDYLPNDDPTIFITSGALNQNLNEANGTDVETNGSPCALELITYENANPFARYTVSINLAKYGIQPGDFLYMEVDGKGNANAFLEVRRNGTDQYASITGGPFGQDWTTLSGAIEVPENTESLALWLYPNYGGTEASTAYFDNLKIINIREANGNRPPIADFTVNPVSGNTPLTINFDANPAYDNDGLIEKYEWDFGDGNPPSTLQSSSHIYNSPGKFYLTLTVTDDGGLADKKTAVITVLDTGNQSPVAVAEANVTSGNAPLTVQFSGSDSTDEEGPISYIWDFADGGTSTIANPSRTFSEGVYIVTLTVTDTDGLTDTENITITVNAAQNTAPVAVATASTTTGNAPLTVQFTGSDSTDEEGPISYIWDFADGGTSTIADPSRTFSEGVYNVTLTVTDTDGLTDTENITITVNAAQNTAPVAVAAASTTTGNAPLTVQFSGSDSTDEEGPISYIWDFADGGTSTIADPSRTFSEGVYNVTLTVTDTDGLTDTENITITVNDPDNQPPVAKIEANPLSGNAPLFVEFSGQGSTNDNGIVSYEWNFGDETTSNGIDVNHTYNTVGEYIVTLTVTDAEGLSDEMSVTISVNDANNQAPVAIISTNMTEGEAPLTIDFKGTDSTDDSEITIYAWDFGNGDTVQNANPQYTYTLPGTYNVLLTVTDNEGLTNTASTTIVVNEAPVDCSEKLIETYYTVNNGAQELNSTILMASVGDDITLGLQPNTEMFTVTGPLNKELNVLPLVIENAQESNSGEYVLQTEDGCSFTISVQIIPNETLNNASVEDIIIYPNPVRNETLKIDLSKFMNEGINIGFYDIYGKLVFQEMIKENHEEIFELDLSTLSRGMYLMEIIKSSNDNSTIKKVIKIE